MGSIPVELNGSEDRVPQIIDIRSDTASFELKKDILAGLHPTDGGEKTLPTLLLYDDKGLKLFEEITYLEQYYLTGQGTYIERRLYLRNIQCIANSGAEILILEHYADRIADRIPDGALIVELGKHLRALQRAKSHPLTTSTLLQGQGEF